MPADKYNVVFVLAPPGSGKGTQCKKIVEEFGYVHLSTGDLLAEERDRPGSENAETISECRKNGILVPIDILLPLLEHAMAESGHSDFLIDGFPRNDENLNGWNASSLAEKAEIKFAIFFECDEEICIERCLSRGAAGSGRDDDNPETLHKRFETYNKDTKPMVDHLEKESLLRRIDAKRTVDEIYADVKKLFQN